MVSEERSGSCGPALTEFLNDAYESNDAPKYTLSQYIAILANQLDPWGEMESR